MTRKQKKNLIRILIASGLLVILHFVPDLGIIRFFLYLIPYLIVGGDILKKAAKGIWNRQPFDECLLMAIATIGAMAIALYSNGDYTEGIAVMLFYQIGEWFQSYAVGKSRRNIAALMDIRPDNARVLEDGQMRDTDPDEVATGSIIVVEPGEKIPIDGVVIKGRSSVDTAALTGESMPRDVAENDEVISGCVNLRGELQIRTTKEFGESTVSKVLELVENASSRKSSSENFITKFARVYTPVVVGLALLLAILPPLGNMVIFHGNPEFGKWIYRGLTFLVISCPCALVISIPLTFFAGLGAASKEGVLIKGSNYLEAMSKVRILVFDKTGTLTKGVFSVAGIYPVAAGGEKSSDGKAAEDRAAKEELLELAAMAECASTHPIAKSLRSAYGKEIDRSLVDDITEISGFGVSALIRGKRVLAGNDKLMKKEQISYENAGAEQIGTIVHVAKEGVYLGYVVIADTLREGSKEAIASLHAMGIEKTVMLTGDEETVAKSIAEQVGITEYAAKLLPGDKVEKVEAMLSEKRPDRILAFAGDGINDAPVLARADIGIAMGAMGSDAAIEAADVVLMDDDPKGIAAAIRISKRCMKIVYENIWFAIGIKVLCLILGAVGIANMWLAIFADVGVMILCVLNAIRILLKRKKQPANIPCRQNDLMQEEAA
ncbi:MAG: heavy metal translocating P-type ATPase [Lachnospiraceae bacterium]|nr:heavy metal translocating P-type ATPase [Lachnospiraceae bacterium]